MRYTCVMEQKQIVEIKQMEDGKAQMAQENIGIAFREFEQTLVKKLTKSELQHVNEAICALTNALKR